MLRPTYRATAVSLFIVAAGFAVAGDGDPPAGKPSGPRPAAREGAFPGCVELSDGTVLPGRVYFPRGQTLKVFDGKHERHRDVPLPAVSSVETLVLKAGKEKEWRPKEGACDEKVYTGRSYPVREYTHQVTLRDGRAILGPLSGVVCVEPAGGGAPRRFLLQQRDKGKPGSDLKSLVYVRRIRLGGQALEEGKKAAARAPGKAR